jgi:hypothetical protein
VVTLFSGTLLNLSSSGMVNLPSSNLLLLIMCRGVYNEWHFGCHNWHLTCSPVHVPVDCLPLIQLCLSTVASFLQCLYDNDFLLKCWKRKLVPPKMSERQTVPPKV